MSKVKEAVEDKKYDTVTFCWMQGERDAHGNNIKHYGDLDSTMASKRLAQKGAIKRFIRA